MGKTAVSRAIAVASLVVALGSVPAQAATGVCVESLTIGFAPNLTLASTSGVATFTSTRVCTSGGRTQTFTAGYTGNCLVATLSGGGATVSLVAGGVLHLGVQLSGGTERVTVLVPNAVCNTSVASGVGMVAEDL